MGTFPRRLRPAAPRKIRYGVTAALMTAALALAGCSTPGSSSSAAKSGGTSVASAKAAVQKNYAGTDGPVPSSGPAAAKNKSIWVITCGQAGAGCAVPGNATVAAARAIGWRATICDGKLNPSVYGECVSTAAAARPSAIVLVSVDCQFVKAPLQRAKAAGIKVFGVNNFDCDSQGAAKLFDGQIRYHGFNSFKDYVGKGLGSSIGDYIIAKTDGKAKTLLVRQDDNLAAKSNVDGIDTKLAGCGSCTTYTLTVTLNDMVSGGLADKVNAALTRHPDANAVAAPFDAALSLGVAQGVAKSGRKLLVTGLEGLASNIALIKKGEQTMAAGTPAVWTGWAAVDELNRIFANQPLVDEGIGFQSVDAQHNLPTVTEFYDGNVDASGKPRQDYKAVYLKSWGK